VISLAGKVTTGLVESNGSLQPRSHLRGDCQESGLRFMPNARNRVCMELLYFGLFATKFLMRSLEPLSRWSLSWLCVAISPF